MDDEFKDLQRLLRLKRYETPPPDYFEDFLIEFHHRQRAELLKRPLWRLVLDRVEGALPTFSPSRYAYAGACATAVAATILASSHILTSGTGGTPTLASTQAATLPVPTVPFVGHASAGLTARVSLYSSKPSMRLAPELDFNRPRPATVSYASSRPRYELDTQPVRYEQPFSF